MLMDPMDCLRMTDHRSAPVSLSKRRFAGTILLMSGSGHLQSLTYAGEYAASETNMQRQLPGQ